MKKFITILIFCSSYYNTVKAQVFFNTVAPLITSSAINTHSMYIPTPPGLLSGNNISTLLIKKHGSWPASAIQALERVRFIWENSITSKTYIEVDMYWDNTLLSTTIASSKPTQLIGNFISPYDPYANTWYPAGVANCKRIDGDLSPNFNDIEIKFNAGINWYFGVDGNVPPNYYDFITVALKKLLHGFALTSSVHEVSGQPICRYGNSPDNYLTAYDNLIKNSGSTGMNSFATTPSSLFTTWVTSNLFWTSVFPCNNAYNANGSNPVKLNTPTLFDNTVSVNNTDELTYTNGASSLLSPIINYQEAIHTLNGVAVGMVSDVQNYGTTNTCLFDYVTINNPPVGTAPTLQLYTGSNYQYVPNFHDALTTCGGGPNALIGFAWELEVLGTDANTYTVSTGTSGLLNIFNLTLPSLPAGVDYLRNYDNSIRGFLKLKATENNGFKLYDTKQVKIQYPCISNVFITGSYSNPLTQSANWIKSTNTTTILNTATVKLDANPINGFVELLPGFSTQQGATFVAQALDGCGVLIPH
jgi:hypothetical protein